MYPVLFRIGDIAISSYMVMFIIGFLVAYLPFRSEFKRTGLSEDLDRKSTRLNSSHIQKSRMPSSA